MYGTCNASHNSLLLCLSDVTMKIHQTITCVHTTKEVISVYEHLNQKVHIIVTIYTQGGCRLRLWVFFVWFPHTTILIDNNLCSLCR